MTSLLLAGAIYVTGYTCPPYCGTTADGTQVGPSVAACPAGWQGLTVDIADVGRVQCHDSYAPGLSARIDVFMPTLAACYAITGWHQYVVVQDDQRP